MKQIRYRLIFTALAAVALLAIGCSKELQGEDITDGTYLSLSIDGAKVAASAQRGSRATAVNESVVNDLWVLQFQMEAGSSTVGTLVKKIYIDNITEPAKIKFIPNAGDNMALYLVANSGNSGLFSSTDGTTTLAMIKATSASVFATAGNNFPTDVSANLPMVGQSATIELPTATKVIPVALTRVAAKVVLTIKNPLETGYPQLTVSSVQLKNAPKAYLAQVVNAANGFTGTTHHPAAAAGNFMNYTAVEGNVVAAGTTSTYYLAPNVRGISTNTDYRLKSDLTAPADQGNFCTYVEIIGTAQVSDTAPEVDVRYRLYLGANNTNNFNLEANTAYKVDVELTGINGNDARMRITTDKFDLIQGDTDGNNSEDILGFKPPAIGDYYYSDGSYSTDFAAGKTATGLIYYLNPTYPKKFLVMSLEEKSKIAWAAADAYIVSKVAAYTNGKVNSAAIKAAFDLKIADESIDQTTFEEAFPAAAYCYNHTGMAGTDPVGSWYLPARDELHWLWCSHNGVTPKAWGNNAANNNLTDTTAQVAWNKRIEAGGGTALSLLTYFWTSSEIYNNDKKTSTALRVEFSTSGGSEGTNSGTYGASKTTVAYTGDLSVRCIRDI